jgi:hypothetical protein
MFPRMYLFIFLFAAVEAHAHASSSLITTDSHELPLSLGYCTDHLLVLSPKHQPIKMLRSSRLYRVFRTNQACRTNNNPPRVGARRVPILRTRELWCCLHAAAMAHRYQCRPISTCKNHPAFPEAEADDVNVVVLIKLPTAISCGNMVSRCMDYFYSITHIYNPATTRPEVPSSVLNNPQGHLHQRRDISAGRRAIARTVQRLSRRVCVCSLSSLNISISSFLILREI